VPEQILYDRMRTAVLGEVDARGIVYNDKLLALAAHYGFVPRACRPYRAKTKGKVERPFRYVREDFFLARSFRNLDDLNAQFAQWLDQVANRRLLRLERRISHEGMISVGGNLYSVPDGTRRRPVEVQVTASEVHILEDGRPVAVHPVLEGRGRRRIAEGHRSLPPPHNSTTPRESAAGPPTPPAGAGGVAPRSLAIYEAIGRRLAAVEPAR
jgi:hypothetical protein